MPPSLFPAGYKREQIREMQHKQPMAEAGSPLVCSVLPRRGSDTSDASDDQDGSFADDAVCALTLLLVLSQHGAIS